MRAVLDLAACEQLDPQIGWPHRHRALLFATCPDDKYRNGSKALEQLKKARALLPPGAELYVAQAAVADTDSREVTTPFDADNDGLLALLGGAARDSTDKDCSERSPRPSMTVQPAARISRSAAVIDHVARKSRQIVYR